MNEDIKVEVPDITRDGRLAGKVAIVTGGGSQGSLAGSGAAISILFAAKGASVMIVDRDEVRAVNTQRVIHDVGEESAICVADITEAGACLRVAASTVERFRRIDVLVNNAAIAPVEREPSEKLWDDVMNLNLRAAKLMTDAVIPQMTKQGAGSVVNIASTAGLRGGSGVTYSAAKSGLMGLTRAMAYEHGRAGVRLNSIAPGHMHTPMGVGLDSARRLRAAAGLVDAEGSGWDVAYAALFLASDEARWITAVTLPVDGGTTAATPLRMFPHLALAAKESGAG